MEIHVVSAGESIYSIANQYGVSARDVIRYNGLPNPGQLVTGQTIVILFPRMTHIVEAGETASSIARENGLTVNQLYRNNPGLNVQNALVPGQSLVISYEGEKEGELSVNGYAYPFISRDLLRRTLPYLTYLTPFTYGITNSGGLVELDDLDLIAMAKEYGVAPLMHLSTLTEEGNFSTERAARVLNDMDLQNILIGNVLQNLQDKGYYGLDVDFEFIGAENRDQYVAFIRNLAARLNPLGYEVITALAPKTSSTQPGLLYEGHDYAGLGEASNAVLLMTYEWGYTYGPPMAVAPIANIRAVLDYAVTQIPRDKIYLGIPNYGYDWPLPFVQGTTRARSISNMRAVQIALENGASIEYSDESQAPHFTYYNQTDGRQHEVWFEDARSIRVKLALVPEYGLLGVGYWNLMRPFPQNWLVLNSLYEIRQIF